MKDIEVWAVVVGAVVAIVTLWWSITAQTREIRAGRADDLRRRLLHAKTAGADAWDLVRNGETLVQIGSTIGAEARERLSARETHDGAFDRLADNRIRAEIASFGWNAGCEVRQCGLEQIG